jgi:hypothetical protein
MISGCVKTYLPHSQRKVDVKGQYYCITSGFGKLPTLLTEKGTVRVLLDHFRLRIGLKKRYHCTIEFKFTVTNISALLTENGKFN